MNGSRRPAVDPIMAMGLPRSVTITSRSAFASFRYEVSRFLSSRTPTCTACPEDSAGHILDARSYGMPFTEYDLRVRRLPVGRFGATRERQCGQQHGCQNRCACSE